MLEQIGGECAGAITFVPTGEPLPESDYRYRTLSSEELAAVLRELPKRPLLAGEEGIRLSLAGAQDTPPAPGKNKACVARKRMANTFQHRWA